jgi:hypothetical protein
LKAQVDLDNINFVSNDRLLEVMQRTTATPAQVAEATRINTEARLQALKIGFLVMAGLALLALFPAGDGVAGAGVVAIPSEHQRRYVMSTIETANSPNPDI